jgi:cytochrome c peroxidase
MPATVIGPSGCAGPAGVSSLTHQRAHTTRPRPAEARQRGAESTPPAAPSYQRWLSSRCDFALTDSASYVGKTLEETAFHNTGLYDLGGTGDYPQGNRGLYEFTRDPADMGRFKAPTLRNVAVTAPYMHDGSIATLDEVLDHYASGGRTIASGPHAGVGRDNPYKSELINGFELSAQERADLMAFLHALTDVAFLGDPRFADPWR